MRTEDQVINADGVERLPEKYEKIIADFRSDFKAKGLKNVNPFQCDTELFLELCREAGLSQPTSKNPRHYMQRDWMREKDKISELIYEHIKELKGEATRTSIQEALSMVFKEPVPYGLVSNRLRCLLYSKIRIVNRKEALRTLNKYAII